MDYGGINGGTAKSYDHKARKCHGGNAYGEKNKHNSAQYNCRAYPYHIPVTEPVREKSRNEPSCGYADEEKGGICGCVLFGKSLCFRKIAACPEHHRGFGGTIGEKSQEQAGHAFYFKRIFQSHGLSVIFRTCGGAVVACHAKRKKMTRKMQKIPVKKSVKDNLTGILISL